MNTDQSMHELIVDIKNAKSEEELLKIVTFISSNSKRLRLDDSDLQKLEAVGLQQYENMHRIRNDMIRNKKHGFNNFNDD